ncbi:hypothetical protein C8P69_12212 [Phreatobacter oligotrophus]|uniref:Uncharacterized protein n=1 Tax=Phreatobacter oligotrophus TaxID=1122261 RepID=A0A2T4YWK1_9HYPH|nr:hypothetical protein [Phreatobacter oligotrophus]PTM48839.1 hypothetical protein C8P69_12212 [Phreatobacter oligotrophus]
MATVVHAAAVHHAAGSIRRLPLGAMTAMGARATEFGEDFGRRAEGEVVQHDHDVLYVARIFIVRDHRRGEELLLAQLMRVHPMGARSEPEGVGIAGPGGNRATVRP